MDIETLNKIIDGTLIPDRDLIIRLAHELKTRLQPKLPYCPPIPKYYD